MAPFTPWNRSGVPRELSTGPERVVFVRRRRLHSFLLGCLSAGVAGVAGKLLWGGPAHLVGIGVLTVWGLTAAGFLLDAMTSVWRQRMLVVDLEGRELLLFSRSPLRRSRESYAFSALLDLRVDRPMEGYNSVVLTVTGGASILLGRDFDERATPFARRLAALTGVPLRP